MKYSWPVFLLCAALLVAVAVLALLNLQPGVPEIGGLVLRDPSGARFETAGLRGKVWVAGAVGRRCLDECPGALARLAELHDGLPDEVRLITFVLGSRGSWPPRPAIAADRRDWIFVQGNATDADGEPAVRDLVRIHLGLDETTIAGLVDGDPALWITTVDRRGRHRRTVALPRDGGANEALGPVYGDLDFLAGLDGHPLRHAALNGLSAVLLITGYVLIRRKIRRGHIACMLAATGTTTLFLLSYLHYHYQVGSISFRGVGWSRPLYFSILLTHTVLAAFVVPLAGTLLFHAARGRFDRHRAIARWTLPIWIYVSITGVLIYFMLYIWFP